MRRNLIAAVTAVLVLGWTSTAQSINADAWVVAGDALLLVKVRGEPGSFKAKGTFDGRADVESAVVAFSYQKITFNYVAPPPAEDLAKPQNATWTFDLPEGVLQLDVAKNKPKRAKLASNTPESQANIGVVFDSFFRVVYDDAFVTKARLVPAIWGDPHVSESNRVARGKLNLRKNGTRLTGNPRVDVRGTFGSGPLQGKQFKARLLPRFLGGQEGEE